MTRYQTLQWLMWQMGGVGPMFGQLGFFHAYGGKDFEDKRPWTRYKEETQRLLDVLDDRLADRAFIMGDDYTIADIAIWPWVRALDTGYKAWDLLEIGELDNVMRWFETCSTRPASQKAVNIPPRP